MIMVMQVIDFAAAARLLWEQTALTHVMALATVVVNERDLIKEETVTKSHNLDSSPSTK